MNNDERQRGGNVRQRKPGDRSRAQVTAQQHPLQYSAKQYLFYGGLPEQKRKQQRPAGRGAFQCLGTEAERNHEADRQCGAVKPAERPFSRAAKCDLGGQLPPSQHAELTHQPRSTGCACSSTSSGARPGRAAARSARSCRRRHSAGAHNRRHRRRLPWPCFLLLQ